MPSPSGTSTTSLRNHTMLVQLTDAVTGLGKQVGNHIAEQQLENDRLHQRIDSVQNETRKGVDEIKNSLAQTGKVSASHVAVFIGMLTLFGGFAQFFLDTKLGNITPVIEDNRDAISGIIESLNRVQNDLTHEQMENASRHATSQENRRWLEREAELMRQKLRDHRRTQ